MSKTRSDDACHILIMADFSGRDNLGLNNKDTLMKRKITEVDRDNIDYVFQRQNVKVRSTLVENALEFSEIEELHPDVIYEQAELFSRLRILKRKLKNSDTFAAAAEEIYQWSNIKKESIPNENNSLNSQNADKLPESDNILDSVLSNSKTQTDSSQFDIQALIKDIVAPYVLPKPDPRLEELLETIDEATSNLMRNIMHDRAFQRIESAWRSLELLVRRIETNSKLKLFIVDVSQRELIEDSSNPLEQSALYQLIVSSRSSIGDTAFSLIMHADRFGESIDDISALHRLSKIASETSAIAVASVTEQLAGCESLALTPDYQDWNYSQNKEIVEAWDSLRKKPDADNLICVAPRYLGRMPYGQKSAPIESFSYEELTSDNRHQHYLWSSGAWLVTLLIAQNFEPHKNLLALRYNKIENLPLHVYYEDDESEVTPCAEINMSDTAFEVLKDVGICGIRSIKNKDSVLIPGLNSISLNNKL